jgi:methylmalonyl-CoA/ethylmalonyl-CoA epimerase
MKLDHVALATRDASGPLDVLAGELGGTILSGGHALGFRPMQVFLGDDTGGMKVELLEPWEPEQHDFLERFVLRHGAGPHHLTFKVADLEATIEHVRSSGYSPVGINLADPQWQEAFLPPKEAHGTVVQLAQSNATLATPIDEYRFAAEHGSGGDPVWWRAPAHRAETPTFLRRVVLRTPALPAALDFFAGLLQGEAVGAGDAWTELAWSTGGHVRLEEHAGATPGIDRLELEGPGEPRELTLAGTRLVIRPA